RQERTASTKVAVGPAAKGGSASRRSRGSAVMGGSGREERSTSIGLLWPAAPADATGKVRYRASLRSRTLRQYGYAHPPWPRNEQVRLWPGLLAGRRAAGVL